MLTIEDLEQGLGELIEILELAVEEDDQGLFSESEADLEKHLANLAQLEFQRMFAGPMDLNPAYLEIQSGSGGTEAQDWADMLLRMYLKWCERKGFKAEIIELSDGDVAGIKSATVLVEGAYAYGWLRTETGVHRLVRKSPFDSGNRRHTSFASIFISPDLDDDIEIDLDMSDVRVDTYRASGAGGQHVNKTDSAIRLTHEPSGLVVQCQNQRSQLKNKQTAMKVLKSRIYEKQQDEKRAEMEKFYGDKGEMGWGNQIRSYVFQPYQMVKDLRTGVETGNVQAVMDGALDPFVHAWLRAGGPTSRKAAADREFADE